MGTPQCSEEKVMKKQLAGALILGIFVSLAQAVGYAQTTVHSDRVLAHKTDVYRVHFSAHTRAMVEVSGDGTTDLDLYIYDENGNLVAKDDDNTDDCLASWTPRWSGTFTIRVVNRGSVYNDYDMMIEK
jgi:hypothetical protein